MAITGGNKDIKRIYCGTPNGLVEVTDVYAGTQCLWWRYTLKNVYLVYNDQSNKLVTAFINLHVYGKEGDYVEVDLGKTTLRNTKDHFEFNMAHTSVQGDPYLIIPRCDVSAGLIKAGGTVTARLSVQNSSSTGSVSPIVERIELK